MNFCMNRAQRFATVIAMILFSSVVIWRYVGPINGIGDSDDPPEVVLPSLAIAILYAGSVALLKRHDSE